MEVVLGVSLGASTWGANRPELPWPSLAAILQNVIMIGALFLIRFGSSGNFDPLRFLSFAVLISGVLELLLMFWIVKRENMMIILNRMIPKDFETIISILKLALPGIGGASALQISLIVDRTVAGWIGEYAPASLYFSERLVYLPIGIFAVALGSVLMPALSRSAAAGDWAAMRGDIVFGLRLTAFICMPAAAFVIGFWRPVAELLFLRGNFTEENLRAMTWTMIFYGSGLPLFCSLKVLLPAFYSRRDMRRPLYVSLGCISLNIALNLLLMKPLAQGGIALATVIASCGNNLTLLLLLRRDGLLPPLRSWAPALLRSLIAAVLAVLAVLAAMRGIWEPASAAGRVVLAATLFGAVYLVIHGVSGGGEGREMLNSLRRRARKD